MRTTVTLAARRSDYDGGEGPRCVARVSRT